MAGANRYVSYLSAEIEPRALQNLNRFEKLTEQAFRNIEAFSSRGSSRLGIGSAFGDSTRRNIERTTQSLGQADSALRGTQARVRETTSEAKRMGVAFERAAQSLGIVQGPLGPLAGRLAALGNVLRNLSGFSIAGVLTGGGAFALGNLAADYARVTDKLRPYYDTQQQANAAMRDVQTIARDTRQSLEAVAEVYTRIKVAGEQAGITSGAQISRLSETIAKAARLSGGDRQTQKAGLTQFGQAFGSGLLQGDELRSIRENTFRLAKAIADGLGVTIGELKKLGTDGKLTSEVIAQALARSASQIDLEYSRLPVRIDQALTVAGNNFSAFIGRVDSATGATSGFAKIINTLGQNIPAVAAGLGALAARYAAITLADPFARMAANITRFLALQKQTNAAVAAGTAVRLTPPAIGVSKAQNDVIQGKIAQANMREEVAARRAETAALQEKLAAQRQVGVAELENARTVQAAAAQEQAARAAEAAAIRARAEALAAQLVQERAVLQTKRESLVLIEANVARGGLAASSAAVAESRAAEAAAAQAAATTELRLAGVTRQLVAADAEATAAAEALTVANTQLSVATDVRARAGFAALGASQNLTLAELRLSLALKEQQLVALASTANMERLTIAQRALAASTTIGARAIGVFRTAWAGVSALLGGPVGITLAAVTAGMIYFGSRTDEAKSASERFAEAQKNVQNQAGRSAEALRKAAQAAAAYQIELAKAGVQEAQKKQRDARSSLQNSLLSASGLVDLSSAQGRRDFATLRRLGNASPDSGELKLSTIQGIMKRNPNAFQDSSILGFFNSNPGDAGIKAVGLKQTSIELAEARRNLQEVQATANTPLPPIKLGNGRVRSTQELEADAQALAQGGTTLQRARAEYRQTKEQLDSELKAHRDKGDYSFDDEYVRKVAAAETQLRKVEEAQRGAAAASRAHNAAIRQANQDLRSAAAAEDQLATALRKYTEEPTAIKQAEAAKQAVDKAFRIIKDGKESERGSIDFDGRKVTKAEAYRIIDEGTNKPLTDALEAQKQIVKQQELSLAGRQDEADVMDQAYQLQKKLGGAVEDYVQALLPGLQREREINNQLTIRNRLIDNYASAIANVYGTLEQTLAKALQGKLDPKGFVQGLRQAFAQAKAREIVVKLFGDPEQRFRDEMTRGLNSSADKLETAGDRLIQAAESLVGGATGAGTGIGGLLGSRGSVLTDPGDIAPDVNIGELARFAGLSADAAAEAASAAQDIVVKAPTLVARQPGLADPVRGLTTTALFNKIGGDIGKAIFGASSPITKVTGKLGTLLEGAAYGGVGSTVAKSLGFRGSSTGGAIGGALGQVAGEALGKSLGTALGSLGQFAGPLGAIAGGLIGSVVGGLFKKAKTGSSTLTSVDGAGALSGNNAGMRGAANSAGQSVQSGIQKIADALGGSTGGFAVSIGLRDGKYRVDPTGSGNTKTKRGAIDFGEDQEAAIKYAILNAIQDGAVKGIRAGAQRLLQAGQDLDVALQKAVKFNDVFRQLKAIKDPVGAAIDDLNTEFSGLIRIFKEAGASAEENAQLQELYNLKREDAVKQATNNALGGLDRFITDATASNNSPLSKRTRYDNATAALTGFRADIAAGKSVDVDKLTEALTNVQDTSRGLNGSRSPFYSDFNDLIDLAKKARENIASNISDPTKYSSPFPDAATKALTDNVTATQSVADLLAAGIPALIAALNGSGNAGTGSTGSTLGILPGSSIGGNGTRVLDYNVRPA